MANNVYQCFIGGFQVSAKLEEARYLSRELERSQGDTVMGRTRTARLDTVLQGARKDLDMLESQGCLEGAESIDLSRAQNALDSAVEYADQYSSTGGAPVGLEFEIRFAERLIGGFKGGPGR